MACFNCLISFLRLSSSDWQATLMTRSRSGLNSLQLGCGLRMLQGLFLVLVQSSQPHMIQLNCILLHL